LRSDDGRQIDIHPVKFDRHGIGWQRGAGPDGSDCPYPPEGFGHGVIQGETVPCLTATLLLEHHTGYSPRDRDRADVRVLTAAFDLPVPTGY
jgi:lincosamide nucleotidyltransferase A/C/D/E